MLVIPERNNITSIAGLSKKIQYIVAPKKTTIPTNILNKYICSCFESFNLFFTKSFLGTARYIVSIVMSTPINEADIEANVSAFRLSILLKHLKYEFNK
jgi:hypothetical protein